MLAAIENKVNSLRSLIYDTVIVRMTSRWYREVLIECPVNASVLDVGIGTATSLIANRDIVVSKQLNVTGVDYDLDYVKSAQANIAAHNLQDAIRVEHASIHDFNKDHAEKFDILYFSGSFMIIPDQAEALKHCVAMLRSPVPAVPNGCNIYFTQTFEHPTLIGKYVVPMTKWLMRLLTTIDFGQVTFESDFNDVLEKAGVEVRQTRVIQGSYFRSQVLVMARPKLTSSAH